MPSPVWCADSGSEWHFVKGVHWSKTPIMTESKIHFSVPNSFVGGQPNISVLSYQNRDFPQGNINGIIKLSWLQRWHKLLKWREFFLGFVWWTESGVSKHSDLRFYMRHARKMGFGADFHWCRKDMNWRLAPLTCTCPKARLCKLWAEPKLSELDMLIMFLCQEVAHLSPWGATTHSIHCNLDELVKFPPSQKNNCEASGIALGIGSNC